MADGHGGYRKPSNPAPVSPPGANSKRTDGGPSQVMSTVPDQPYGDATQQMNDQRVAPMGGKTPPPPPAPMPNTQAAAPGGQGAPYQGGAFNAPSSRPNEPVTAGVPIGPGPGPSISPIGPDQSRATGAMTQLLSSLQATDTTGVLAALYQQAQARGA